MSKRLSVTDLYALARRTVETQFAHYYEIMGKNKKTFDEQLQETRTKNHNKLRYRKRVQQEQEADKELKEFTKRQEKE
jgi:hypothetical protein